jgi:hypothetical protein
MKPVMLVGLLLAVVASIGCGTLYNLDFASCCCGGRPEGHRIYGGVETDVAYPICTFREMRASNQPLPIQVTYVSIASILGLVDLPLSIVADTVTLPLTIAAQIQTHEQTKAKQASTETREPAATQERIDREAGS